MSELAHRFETTRPTEINRFRENIFWGLKEMEDYPRHPATFAVDSILTDHPKAVLLGEPSNGKTWIMRQLMRALVRNAPRRGIDPHSIHDDYYDNFLALKEAEYGGRDNFGQKGWRELNGSMVDYIAGDGIRILEMPGVGMNQFRDVGVSALENMLERSRDCDDTLYTFIANNALLELFGGILREKIEELPEDEVVNFLHEHHIQVSGINDPVRAGELIKDQVSKSAKLRHIWRIRTEERAKITDWATSLSHDLRDKTKFNNPKADQNDYTYDPRELRRANFSVPQKTTPAMFQKIWEEFYPPIDQSFYKRLAALSKDRAIEQAIYMRDKFDQAGLDHTNSMILFNPFNRSNLVWELSEKPLEKGNKVSES